ncbi:MAG: cohesin domain-containing protein, partial [Pirellula sp.]
MRLSLSGSTPLGAGPQIITRLLGSVPANVAYGASDLVRVENLSVFTLAGGATPVPSISDAGIHKAVFIGDTNADGLYTAQDSGWISGVVVSATTGFDAFSWTDPVIVADVTQNGLLEGLDAAWITRKGLSSALQPEIPNLPAGSLPVPAGVDPTIAADALITGLRGGIAQVPIQIVDSATGLWGVDVFLNYDTNVLDLPNGLNAGGVAIAGIFDAEAGWIMDTFVDDAVGVLRIALYHPTASTTTNGVIANVNFQVKPTAAFGVTPILVDGHANVPPFSFSFQNGSVNVVNSQPTDINLNQNVVLENTSTAAADLLFGQLATVDLDPVDSYIYDLVSGTGDTDNARFSIVADQIFIEQGELLDFETRPSYNVRVRSTDSGGLQTIKQLTLNVTDVNEAVVLTRTSASLTGNVLTTFTNTGNWSDPENGTVTLSASHGTVIKNNDGTWSWSFTPSTKLVNELVTITANDGTNTSSTSFTLNALVAITNRQVYYKGSDYATLGGVGAALDNNKSTLASGPTAQSTTDANKINYSRGLNGMVIDVAGLVASSLTASDFTFRVAPTGASGDVNPSAWASAPVPTSIVVT